MGSYRVCFITVDNVDTGTRIARTLVERKLAACVNMIPQVRSIYTWKGEICDESEILMIAKTRTELFEALKQAVRELHPYEVPEIISLPIDQGLPEYLTWIDASTDSTP